MLLIQDFIWKTTIIKERSDVREWCWKRWDGNLEAIFVLMSLQLLRHFWIFFVFIFGFVLFFCGSKQNITNRISHPASAKTSCDVMVLG